eukprot:10598835-Alexandrium_andersonii.AAC.1
MAQNVPLRSFGDHFWGCSWTRACPERPKCSERLECPERVKRPRRPQGEGHIWRNSRTGALESE